MGDRRGFGENCSPRLLLKNITQNIKMIKLKTLIRTPIFTVTQDKALDPEGHQISRAIIQHGGSAVMMPVDENRRILLVRQYRLPARDYMWELPAGRLDPGETPRQAARRELR